MYMDTYTLRYKNSKKKNTKCKHIHTFKHCDLTQLHTTGLCLGGGVVGIVFPAAIAAARACGTCFIVFGLAPALVVVVEYLGGDFKLLDGFAFDFGDGDCRLVFLVGVETAGGGRGITATTGRNACGLRSNVDNIATLLASACCCCFCCCGCPCDIVVVVAVSFPL